MLIEDCFCAKGRSNVLHNLFSTTEQGWEHGRDRYLGLGLFREVRREMLNWKRSLGRPRHRWEVNVP
jgi:hypothetical protein